MNAAQFKEWAKREYDRAVKDAKLVLDTRLEAAKHMGAANVAGRRSAPASLPMSGNGNETAKDSGADTGLGLTPVDGQPEIAEAIRAALSGRVGTRFKLREVQDWVVERFPGFASAHSSWHRALKNLVKKGVIQVSDNKKGKAGFTYEVLNPNKE